MNMREYIQSGIIESYALGIASTEEQHKLETLLPTYPELRHALRSFEEQLKWHASQVKPPVWVKIKILEMLSDAEEEWSTRRLQSLAKNPDKINDLTPRQFEKLTAALLRRQGYTVTLTQATRDGGKDMIVAHHTGFGQFLYFVECKKHGPAHKVGVEVIRQLYGVIARDNITAGILVTNTYFTADAVAWQETISYRLKLVDRTILLKWIVEML